MLAACLCFSSIPSKALELAGVDQLTRGMRGYGLTVIEGSRIDTFGVEILGVERNSMLPGRDLILVRLSGLGLEDTGIVRGMSGSPVYVDDHLVGAVAWGWLNAEEPIGLLTPIHEMLSVLERDLTRPVDGAADAPALSQPTGFVRLAAPVWVSGVGRGTARMMTDLLSPLGLEPLAAPTGLAPAHETPAPRAGSAIGVQLVGGDLSLAAIGTVTHVDGERVVAFGHEFLGSGAVDLPMTGVHMFGVLDNRVASFKLGTATGIVGAARQDRFGAVAGLLGARAEVLPVRVSVVAAGGSREFAFDVARHRFLTSRLTQIVLMGALESTTKASGDASVELTLDIELVDGSQVTWRQMYSGVNASVSAAIDAGRPLSALVDAPFEELRIAAVRARAEVREEEIRVAQIVEARLHRPRVRAGDTATVSVQLARYRGSHQVLQVDLEIPPDAAGRLSVRVGSARAALAWEDDRLAVGPSASAAELVRRLNRPRRDDELVVQVMNSDPGLTVGGRELPSPPPSVRRLLSESHAAGATGPVAGRILFTARLPAGYVLHGEHSLVLTVDSKGSR